MPRCRTFCATPITLIIVALQVAVHAQESLPLYQLLHHEGVGRALVIVDWIWTGGIAAPTKFVKTVYYSKMDPDCSQILAPERLMEFNSSGLEDQLAAYAKQATKFAHWNCVEGCPSGARGYSVVEVVDAPWQPAPDLRLLAPGWQLPEAWDEVAVQTFTKSATGADKDAALLNAASYTEDSCVLKALLNAGAHVNARGSNGETAFMNASVQHRVHSFQLLLKSGADVNAQDLMGETALIMAARGGDLPMVQMLLDAGADPSIHSRTNRTALFWAERYHHNEIEDLLQRAKAQAGSQ